MRGGRCISCGEIRSYFGSGEPADRLDIDSSGRCSGCVLEEIAPLTCAECGREAAISPCFECQCRLHELGILDMDGDMDMHSRRVAA